MLASGTYGPAPTGLTLAMHVALGAELVWLKERIVCLRDAILLLDPGPEELPVGDPRLEEAEASLRGLLQDMEEHVLDIARSRATLTRAEVAWPVGDYSFLVP